MSTSIMHAPPFGQGASPSSKSTLTQQLERTSEPAAQRASPSPGKSTLTQQIERRDDGGQTPRSSKTPFRYSPNKPRSLSDAPKPVLSPSPAFREPSRRVSKDDSVITDPSTPTRPPHHIRGLSLHMPAKDGSDSNSGESIPRVPLSPKLDSSQIYGSPSSMLPRRSRGLDYTRACTSLHQSTLAEASPDASPNIGRGIQIPARRSLTNNVLDSPSNQNGPWSLSHERTNLSSSVSSINMLGSDSETDADTDSDDMAIDRELDDAILNTPAASRLNTGSTIGLMNSPGLEWMNNTQPSPAQASLMNFQPHLMSFRRARIRKGKSQHSSSSVSMNSSKPSPGPLSPGVLKSVENANGSYFGMGLTKQQVQSRRESLSLGTNDLHLSDSEDNNTNKTGNRASLSDMDTFEGPRGVIRRAVTRRSNLLPKPKGFARIRAQLLEESEPTKTELRREAEVIRQVQENDPTVSQNTSPIIPSNGNFTAEPVQDSIEDIAMDATVSLPPDSFSRQAERNSGGVQFWNGFDGNGRLRTPPPGLLPRESSSAVSDEVMDTPGSSIIDNPALKHFNRSRSRSVTPLANYPPTAGEVARRVNNKRRREEDFDPSYTKRRAVSPGMSVQSSPVIPQSPVFNNDKAWAKLPPKPNGQGPADRSNSAGSMNGSKKVGLQGMSETNEGMMSMSID
ncbi:hypothetical protein LTS13_004117 [Exophiala xenobiotica]|nr:hypothetical protein LTR92_007984 [Exophiala xenobiotica]KAK5316446.1 hypothetical protein LTR93_009247 [Exophiala xenobiotica]KAK5379225.1 hypothetical protein LTS13_004117 [Exophiala xenobiotica]KAK5412326.1 hypothetical protein LTR06_005296 [Exophiala xenobiotica]KAK5532571.1 hypothetical protein LTR23_009540 [Chaetothyriales sp. CCFEE 6169]